MGSLHGEMVVVRAVRAVAVVGFLIAGLVCPGSANSLDGSPAGGAIRTGPVEVTVSGVVDSGHGNLQNGSLNFYADCAGQPVAWARIRLGAFTTTLPPGRYRVRISGETTSWHDAKPTCETATVLTFSADTYVTLKAVPLFTVTGTVGTRRGAVSWGSVLFQADCQSPEVVRASITKGAFTVKLIPGSYRVRVQPGQRITSALDSWHSAKTTCLAADVVTVTGDQSMQVVGIAAQHVALRQPKTVAAGIRRALPARTGQGVAVRWTSRSKKVCSVRHKTILRTLKKGSCSLRAVAPAGDGLAAYQGFFVVNVYERRGQS